MVRLCGKSSRPYSGRPVRATRLDEIIRSSFISSSLQRSLRRERTNKFLRFLRGEKPRPTARAFDPYETIRTRDIHLDQPPPLRPERAESTPKSASTDSHTPSDLPFQLLPVHDPRIGDVLSGNVAAFEGPSHLKPSRMHGEAEAPSAHPLQQRLGYPRTSTCFVFRPFSILLMKTQQSARTRERPVLASCPDFDAGLIQEAY